MVDVTDGVGDVEVEVAEGAGDVEVVVTVGAGDVDVEEVEVDELELELVEVLVVGAIVLDVLDVVGTGEVVADVDVVVVDVVDGGGAVVDVVDVVDVVVGLSRTQLGQIAFALSPSSHVSPRSGSTTPLPHVWAHARPQDLNSASSTRTSRTDAARGGSKRPLSGSGTSGKRV